MNRLLPVTQASVGPPSHIPANAAIDLAALKYITKSLSATPGFQVNVSKLKFFAKLEYSLGYEPFTKS